MKLLDVVTSPWAIQPAKLVEIQGIYATHLRGEKIDIAGVEQRLGRPLANEPQAYNVMDGVAILPIEGVIAKRANLFMQISGGVSSELLGRDLRAALADPAVHSIILSIDSPGGTVDGTQALANAVTAGKGIKPIVTVANGTMASAAYWIGAAADAVYIADTTTAVGSIGVVAAHTDVSAAEAQRGVKTTEIAAGKFKRIASQYGPLSDEGRQSIQDQGDYYYSLFVGHVAQARGTTVDKVLSDMADGRMFIGEQAVTAGLVDGVSTLEQVVATLNANRQSAGAARASTPTKGVPTMDRQTLAAEHPTLLAAILAEGQAAGATAERARIQGVEQALIPGHEALIGRLKFDGQSSPGDAALAVNAAERQLRTNNASALANDAPVPVPTATAAAVTPPAKPAANDDPSLPLDQRCKAKWEASAELQAEFSGNFGAFLAYEQASTSGRARVLRKA